jgi:hypothetical protein
MSATCSSESRRDPARSPYSGSGGQGGMKRTWVTRAICSARRRTSAYVSRLKGPASPGRWQGAQLRSTMGAM